MNNWRVLAVSTLMLFVEWVGFGQSSLNINTNNDSGTKTYVADEYVILSPGYHFVGNSGSNQMHAYTRYPVYENIPDPTLFTNATFNAREINTNLPVGVVAGAPSVSASGAANYSIPFQLPKGTNGMEPSLSVVYNSQSGDGLLGKGWNLAGLSMISRVPRTKYQDGNVGGVNLNYSDQFAIDGNRLVLQSGVYGKNQSTYSTEAETFMSIIAYGTEGNGPKWFNVKTKEGLTIQFGNSADSKLVGRASTNIFWRVNKVTDPNGNYMEFEYANAGNDSRISKIKYTGNSNTNLNPYNEVLFFYKTRSDVNTVFISDSEIKSQYLLEKVEMYSAGNLFKSYNFKYGFNKGSYLTEVREIAPDGESLNATIFQYGENSLPFQKDDTFVYAEGSRFTSGDYNGDGITDLVHFTGGVLQIGSGGNTNPYLYQNHYNLYQSNGSSFTYVNGEDIPVYRYVSHNQYIPMVVNRITSDFNGDGLDDILITDSEVTSNYQQYNNISVMFSTGNSFYTYSYGVPSTVWNNGYHSLKPIQVGDFDGDGVTDFFTVFGKRNTSNNWEVYDYEAHVTFSKNNQYQRFKIQDWWVAQNLGSSTDLQVVDYNGDGKDDLMMVVNNQTIIYTLNNNKTSMSILYQSGYPTKWHTFYQGDFNGDGTTDLLTASTDNLSSWTMSYSKGLNGFRSFPFVFTKPYGGDYDALSMIDCNGDGKTDVVHIYRYENKSRVDVYYSTGTGFTMQRQDFIKTIGGPSTLILTAGDYNGDGNMELIYANNVAGTSYVLKFNQDSKEQLLHKVKDGFNQVTQFNYSSLSKLSSYSKGSGAVYPLRNFEQPMYVTTSMNTPNGIGGVNTISYQYNQGLVHLEGKGFLGFKNITTINAAQNHRSTSQYELNTTYYSLYQTHQYEQLNSTSSSISTTVFDYRIKPLDGIRYWPYLNSSTTTNFLTNSTNTVDLEYDNFGNVTQSIATTGDEIITTTNEYGKYGAWIASKLTKQTISSVRGSEATYERVINYQYSLIGNMTKIINDFNTPKAVFKDYQHDGFGNIKKYTLTPTGSPAVVTNYEYDSRGRNLIKTTNALNQISEVVYDETWSKPIQSIGIDGLPAYYKYDSFGRLVETKDAKLNRQKNETLWEIITNGTGDKTPITTTYKVETTGDGLPKQTAWYDALGRKVKTGVEGLVNTSYVTSKYNAKGQLISTTEPFFAGATNLLITYNTYDAYGRPLSVTTGDMVTTMGYQTVSGGGYTVTSVAPGGVTSSKTMDETGKVISATDPSGTLTYSYYSDGQQKEVKMGSTVLASMEYDLYGNQTKLIDADAGTTTYDYDALGQLTSQLDANGHQHTMVYDKMGRIVTRTGSGTEGVTTYEYVTSGNGLNGLKKVTGFNGIEESYTYDMYGRLIEKIEKIDQQEYTSSYEYDYFDRLITNTYPSGFKTKNQYDSKGYLIAVTDNSGMPFYESPHELASGHLDNYKLGNGLTTYKQYDQYKRLNYSHTSNVFEYYLLHDDYEPLITRRSDGTRAWAETFDYDTHKRLVESQVIWVGGAYVYKTPITIDFHNNGNITQKSDVGTYGYGSQKPHAVLAMTNVTNNNISPAEQNITYTPFDRTASISEGGLTLNFTYNANYDRKKSELYTNGQLTRTRLYLGAYEKTIEGNTTIEVHYIAGGEGVCAMHVIVNGVGSTYYVYKDHLGSYNAITDATGNLVHEQNYDAWGRERDANDWSSYTLTGNKPSWLYRGYTGHEMLPEFGLINMNNRLYDPLLGRMLTVDNFVQNPYSAESYNRYSYVLNNPMNYVDPSGEVVVPAAFWVVGAIVGAYAGGTIANGGELNPFQWDPSWKTVGGILAGGALGAIGGYYVGAGIKGVGALKVAVDVGIPGLGSIGTVWKGTGGFEKLQWSTAAGGGGSVDFGNEKINGSEENTSEHGVISYVRLNNLASSNGFSKRTDYSNKLEEKAAITLVINQLGDFREYYDNRFEELHTLYENENYQYIGEIQDEMVIMKSSFYLIEAMIYSKLLQPKQVENWIIYNENRYGSVGRDVLQRGNFYDQ